VYYRLSAFGHRRNVIEEVERIKKKLKQVGNERAPQVRAPIVFW
jgi:hypothetical protein